MIERAIELKRIGNYDQVWCVFDRDDHGVGNFNAAIEIARKNNINVAYSIQAFEYWLILHFEDHQGGKMHRRDYNKKINSYTNPFGINFDGNGNKVITDELFELLDGVDEISQKPRIELAIKRAKRNYEKFDHRSPGTEESSSTVFRLMEEIQKYL